MNRKTFLLAGAIAAFALFAGVAAQAADAKDYPGTALTPNGNPIFTDAWTCDPAPLVVGDRLFVYTGEDIYKDGEQNGLPAYYFLYLRHRLYERYSAERRQRDDVETIEDDIRRVDLELSNLHVSNAVLDNCLSALKHETMYYPSRIRQLIDQQDLKSLPEVTAYYRELYGLLSEQAQHQADRTRLHLTHLDHGILGDEVLIRYLFDILKHMTGQKHLDITSRQRDDKYVELVLHAPVAKQASALTAIDWLLCRQIARDHGEASHRRGCSIREEHDNDETKTIITLPAYGKVQSNHS